MDKMDKICPICGSPTYKNVIGSIGRMTVDEVDCYRCGRYIIDQPGSMELDYLMESNQFNNIAMSKISGWIREKQDLGIVKINRRILQSLISLPELNVFEKADKMLLYLAKKFPVAGTYIPYEFNKVNEILAQIKDWEFPIPENVNEGKIFYKNASELLPLIAIGRVIDGVEFRFIWNDYLIRNKHYFSSKTEGTSNITTEGWAYLETFRHPNPDSKKAFVAMWFDPEMEAIYDDFIEKAIIKAGFEPIQIGRKEHNNDINDEIIGEIRSSKFVVADFTGNRGGVYYEAGFARGLNIEVIQTCREDNLKEVHFDVNHRKIIKWNDGEELYKKLLNRIKATIV